MEEFPIWALEGGSNLNPKVNTKYLIILTSGAFGLQSAWSLVLASGTPYLLSLGFSRPVTAAIWMVGPLSGSFIQPLIGIISDQTATRWGKRKPFIIAGTIGVAMSMASIALLKISAAKIYHLLAYHYVVLHTMTIIVQGLAVFWICVLNLSLQPIQVGFRALIIDSCPPHQQSDASAWSGRFSALGAIVTYLLDIFVMDRYSENNFEVLCSIISLIVIISIVPCLLLIKHSKSHCRTRYKALSLFSRLFKTSKRMPKAVKHVCIVQFVSWLGWFPFLYYGTTYVSSLDVERYHSSTSKLTSPGVQAYLLFALVTFLFSVVLPWTRHSSQSMSHYITDKWTFPLSMASLRPTLRELWILSQVLFAICMICTTFITKTTSAMAAIAFSGISWSLNLWVPLAIISREIAELRTIDKEEVEDLEYVDQTGTLMSIYNIAISAPQILAAGLCSVIFCILDGSETYDSLGLVLRFGGVSSLLAALLIFWLD